jgi:uncharacterized protein
MAQLSISAHDIDAAGLAVETDLPAEWLTEALSEASLRGTSPGHFSGRLSRSGNDIVVRGRISAKFTTPCARCLEPAAVSVDAELSLLLKPITAEGARAHDGKKTNGHAPGAKPAQKEPEDYEFSSEEADTDTYDGDTVVLDLFIREAILLEIPNFPLCSEACPGIRAAARAPAAAVDPRLAPLGALRAKLAAERPGSAGNASTPPTQSARSSESRRAPQKKKKNKE